MTDTLFVSNVNYRTLLGSTITTSTMTVSSITVSTMTASTIFSATGQTALGNNLTYPNRFIEAGSDVANSMYLDFHSSDAALPDYSTRIQSLGGATSGTGGLNMYASTIGLVATNGVGIGTTVPSAALHVYGSSGLSLATTGTVNYTNTSILGFGFGGGSFGTRDSFRIISQVVNRDNGAGPTFYDYGAQADLVFVRKTNNLYSSGASDMTYTEAVRIHGASGFVGIGTYYPMFPLDILTGASGRQTLLRLNCIVSGYGDSTQGPRLEFYTNYSVNGANYFQAAIQSISDNSTYGSGSGGLAFITINNTTQRESMRISSGGFVGIGTTNPVATFHVIGSGRIGTAANPVDIVSNATSGSVQINSPIASFNSYNAGYPPDVNTVVRNSISAYYGVRDGVVSRGCAIDLQDVNTNGTYPTAIRGGQIVFFTAAVVQQGENASPRMIIDPNGYLYFLTYTTNGTLSVTSGNGFVSSSSDRRVKEDIVYVTDTQAALYQVNNLKPATFKFKGKEGEYLGFIAQDVEQFIPLAVDGKKYEYQWEETEDKKPKFDDNGDIVYKLDENGEKIIRPRGLTDRAIIATQTLAIQELSKQLSSTQEQLADKSSKLDALLAWAQTQASAIAALEARLTAAGL